jgi:predicted pyridoxine 5'-phosphate oxidase superfamily flavin-nucleotide-binding protein
MAYPYHEGEKAVQARAGTRDQAHSMARTIKSGLPGVLARFLATQRWLVLGAADDEGYVWASFLTGEPGFVRAADDVTVAVIGHPAMTDPLHAIGLRRMDTPVGMLMIDFARRMRARINGQLHRSDRGLLIDVDQAYANCMKYIQRREVCGIDAARPHTVSRSVGDQLTPTQAELIRRADTAFIATGAGANGADASHRGGPPGFLSCSSDGARIEFVDYPGNGMFNTLGNLMLDERAGLTVLDFDAGAVLAVTGRARLTYHDASPESRDPARVVVFAVDRVVELCGALPFRFGPVEYSPLLPCGAPSASPANSRS